VALRPALSSGLPLSSSLGFELVLEQPRCHFLVVREGLNHRFFYKDDSSNWKMEKSNMTNLYIEHRIVFCQLPDGKEDPREAVFAYYLTGRQYSRTKRRLFDDRSSSKATGNPIVYRHRFPCDVAPNVN
jgi:hypothetical protein